MTKIIYNPPYMILIHKNSGRKLNTRNSEFIAYEEEKFDVKIIQEKLI